MARLQGPRFLVVGDTATVSAVLDNSAGESMAVTPTLDATGMELDGGIPDGSGRARRTLPPVTVPAGGSARADWTVTASQPGTALLKITAAGSGAGDVMELSYTVYDHGVEKLVAKSGKVRATGSCPPTSSGASAWPSPPASR